MHFTGTKYLPFILLLLKHKNDKLVWRISNKLAVFKYCRFFLFLQNPFFEIIYQRHFFFLKNLSIYRQNVFDIFPLTIHYVALMDIKFSFCMNV